jgi:tRNA (guanine-N7-)-methyltransferase
LKVDILEREGRNFFYAYSRRQGRRLRRSREDRFEKDLPLFLLPRFGEGDEGGVLSREKIWGGGVLGCRTVLEIGFGSGEQMVKRLQADERLMILGCEFYRNGIASCVLCMEDGGEGLRDRLRIFPEDVRRLLPYVGEGVFDEISILFPDPWPKKRHHKRRLVNGLFVKELGRVLSLRGEVRLASDHEGVMEWMESVWESEGWCRRDNGGHLGCDFPEDWVETRYQRKGAREGRKSYFACYGRDGV